MSTVTLTELLTAYEIEKQREREDRPYTGLTASVFSGCIRRRGLEVHDVTPTNDVALTSVATVGSLLHMGTAMLWAQRGYDVEVSAEHGTLDAIHRERKEIRDLKSVTRSRFDRWASNNGPEERAWKQAHVYGHDQGADESWTIIIDVLCRETGRTMTYQTAYSPSVAAEAMRDLADGDTIITEGIPDIPDNRYGAGDPVCDNCPFLDYCWGEQAEHPVFDEADIEKFGIALLQAQADAKDAEIRVKANKRRLHGASGDYGDINIRWSTVKGSFVSFERKPYKKLTIGRRSE